MHKLPRKHDMLWLILPGETVHRLPEMRTRLVCCPRWQNAVSRWNSWCRELVGSSPSTLRKCTWSLQECQTQQRDHLVWQPESEQHWGSQSIWLLSSTSHLTSSWVFGTNWRIHYSHHLDVMKGPVICKGIKKWLGRKEMNRCKATNIWFQDQIMYRRLQTSRQTREETSLSKTPRAMTGRDVKATL